MPAELENVKFQLVQNRNFGVHFPQLVEGCGGALLQGPHRPWMRISLPRHDLLGEERWLISQRRRAKSLFLHGLLLGSFCTGIQVKLISHFRQ